MSKPMRDSKKCLCCPLYNDCPYDGLYASSESVEIRGYAEIAIGDKVQRIYIYQNINETDEQLLNRVAKLIKSVRREKTRHCKRCGRELGDTLHNICEGCWIYGRDMEKERW